jgi:putative phosphoribosyl transferase
MDAAASISPYGFRDRAEAGRLLAERVEPLVGRGKAQNLLVLGLPRGGIPVAAQVAKALKAPLDTLVVRKLGFPGHEELAMGALASGGLRVLNRGLIEQSDLTDEEIEEETRREAREIEERERAYRAGKPRLDVEGRTVIVVDDGLATGATLRAGLLALRQGRPARVIAAVPVASREGYLAIAREADETVALLVPDDFQAVGQFYRDFRQVSDGEVREELALAEA